MPKPSPSINLDQYANELAPLKIANVTEMVQEQLIKFIHSNNLAAGQKIPSENQLAVALGVSRVALREALRSMQGLGILEVKAGLGWYVKDVSFDSMAKAFAYTFKFNKKTLADLEEIRINLECIYLKEAIQTLTPEDLISLEQAVAEIETLADAGQSYFEPDRYFHQKIFSRISNRLVHDLTSLFWTLLSHTLVYEQPVSREVFVAQAYKHRPILDAIVAGDAVLADQRLRESITRYFQQYSQA